MDTYRTEEEQVAAIKRIVADHGTKLLLVIVVSIASILGFQGYQQKVLSQKETASLYYDDLVNVMGDSQTLDAKQKEAFDTTFDRLLDEYPQSIYTSYAAFAKAKMEVGSSDLVAASASLQWVVDQNFNQEISELARLRLARVFFSQGEFDKAVSLLELGSVTFAAEYAESKADVLVAKGDKIAAIDLYGKAKVLAEDNGQTVNHILKMKIESLQSVTPGELYTVSKIGEK